MFTCIEQPSSEGGHFGTISIQEKSIKLASVSQKSIFDLNLGNLAQCVIPSNNRDEIEIQFQESDLNRDEDCLVQITLHFPPVEILDEDEDDENDEIQSNAELFQKQIIDTGAIQSLTGNIIAEFGKEVIFIRNILLHCY